MSPSSPEPDYDFGPYEEEYRSFDRNGGGRSGSRLILWLLVLGIVLIVAGVIYNTYRQGVRTPDSRLPVFSDGDAAIKQTPEEAGGAEVPGVDRNFYGVVDGLQAEPETVIAESSPRRLDEQGRDLPPLDDGREDIDPPSVKPPTVAQPSDSSAFDANRSDRVYMGESTSRSDRNSERSIRSSNVGSGAAAQGRFQVQLIAVRSQQAALNEWSRLTVQDPALFADVRLDVQRADLGERGVFYRLRVGDFSDRAAADSYCREIKLSGRNCIVVTRTG